MTPRILPLGDVGLEVTFADAFQEEAYRQAYAVFEELRGARVPGVTDVVLAWTSVAVYWDPYVERSDMVSRLSHLIQGVRYPTPPQSAERGGELFHVPVYYGGELGPDLADVASYHGCSPEEIVQRHTAQPFRVYFLGFSPGFPYLRMDTGMATPKLSRPRPRIKPGSVWIGGEVGGIYSIGTPGGGRIIGWTDISLFHEGVPVLSPGDWVKFEAAQVS